MSIATLIEAIFKEIERLKTLAVHAEVLEKRLEESLDDIPVANVSDPNFMCRMLQYIEEYQRAASAKSASKQLFEDRIRDLRRSYVSVLQYIEECQRAASAKSASKQLFDDRRRDLRRSYVSFLRYIEERQRAASAKSASKQLFEDRIRDLRRSYYI